MMQNCIVSIPGKEAGQLLRQTMGRTTKLTKTQLKRLGGWRSDIMPAKYVDLSIYLVAFPCPSCCKKLLPSFFILKRDILVFFSSLI
jgi:hypothetical protein